MINWIEIEEEKKEIDDKIRELQKRIMELEYMLEQEDDERFRLAINMAIASNETEIDELVYEWQNSGRMFGSGEEFYLD